MSLRKERHNFESFIVKQGTMIDGLRFILRYYIMNWIGEIRFTSIK
jgi:hypothetical protein